MPRDATVMICICSLHNALRRALSLAHKRQRASVSRGFGFDRKR
jgi:hypothetical protein